MATKPPPAKPPKKDEDPFDIAGAEDRNVDYLDKLLKGDADVIED